MVVISIEGNIGVGKSTVLKYLSQKYETHLEPVEKWTLLKNFYENKPKYHFLLQMQILSTQYELKNKLQKNSITLIERSPWTSKNIFFDPKYVNTFENQIYDFSYTKLNFSIDAFIYLDLPLKECIERINKRHRSGEDLINIDYLLKIENAYKEKLFSLNNVFCIDCKNKNVKNIANDIEEIILFLK